VLLANQANLNCADANGASPLHLSVLNGHMEVAKFLIENGAQIDAPDDRGMTAMHHAIAHVDCLSYLLGM
jgi:ankyrin repeat protein